MSWAVAQAFGYIVVIATSLWMYFDAKRSGYDKSDLKGIGALGPIGWLVTGLALWIIAFPLYLACRSMLREAGRRRAASAPPPGSTPEDATPLPRPSIGIFAVALLACAAFFAAQLFGPALLGVVTLPGCLSADVARLGEKILNDNPQLKELRPSVTWSGASEVRMREDPPRRVCKVPMKSTAGTEALYYAIEWQQKEKSLFRLQFLGDADDGK